ncbi:MAG: NAD(P)/FAD-dependent oxidoreductase [Oscillochloridaceae bacterium umkhey_bin13]
MNHPSIIICGAGIAGIAAAYELAVRHGQRNIVLIERGDPLALTSDKSTEAYRNWWPGPDPAMVQLMNRSLDLLEAHAEATNNAILLNRRGYLYASANPAGLPALLASAEAASAHGAGPLRIYRGTASDPAYQPAPAHGFHHQPAGADLLLDPALIQAHFPYLSQQTVAALHVRRAGWFGARQLGMYLLDQARAAGVQLVRGELVAVNTSGGRVNTVSLATPGGTQTLRTDTLVLAGGPLLPAMGRLLDLDLPLHNERHLKASLDDQLGCIPRAAPMLIWNDPVSLPWSDEERAELVADPDLRWLAAPLPAGAHLRPEGGPGAQTLLLLWDYHTGSVEVQFPIPLDEQLPELALRGLATMVPGLAVYLERVPRAYLDGGYYTRTPENRPLIGPLPVAGAWISGGYSGFGLMVACGAAELLAQQIVDAPLPSYAAAFHLARYDAPAYRAAVAAWGDDGQL